MVVGGMVRGIRCLIFVFQVHMEIQQGIVHYLNHASMDATTVLQIAFQLMVPNLKKTANAIKARLAETDTHVLCVPLENIRTRQVPENAVFVRLVTTLK